MLVVYTTMDICNTYLSAIPQKTRVLCNGRLKKAKQRLRTCKMKLPLCTIVCSISISLCVNLLCVCGCVWVCACVCVCVCAYRLDCVQIFCLYFMCLSICLCINLQGRTYVLCGSADLKLRNSGCRLRKKLR
jgi:hypothetical protein